MVQRVHVPDRARKHQHRRDVRRDQACPGGGGTRSCSRRSRRAACSSWRRCATGRVSWATSPIFGRGAGGQEETPLHAAARGTWRCTSGGRRVDDAASRVRKRRHQSAHHRRARRDLCHAFGQERASPGTVVPDSSSRRPRRGGNVGNRRTEVETRASRRSLDRRGPGDRRDDGPNARHRCEHRQPFYRR
jgi:hypothetical protein